MARLSYSPQSLDFGGVPPGSSGPDITLDPSLPPTAVSFAGGIKTAEVPVAGNVTAVITDDSFHFQVRDVLALAWVLEEVDPGELPPGHHGPLPKVKVLESVAQSDGVRPLAVAAGQIVLVRVEYAAHFSEGTWKGTLEIKSDSWDTISVPLSLFLAEVRTDWADASLSIARGQKVSFPIMARLLAGPATPVFYEMSTLQLDTGISLVPSTQSVSVEPMKVAVGSLTFQADPHAPLGENTLFVDQIAFNKRRGNLLPVIVGDHPSASVDDSIRWSLASEQGIQIDDGGTVWHSGRLRDVLVTASREILVAAETGGVWAVTRDGQSVSLADWDKPDVNCLAQGPDGPQHVYAAGQGLFETDVLSGIPLLSWKEIPLIDATGSEKSVSG